MTFAVLRCNLSLQYFNNEEFEGNEYDKELAKYESAALKTTTSLSVLNFGQSATFSIALTTLMVMASQGIVSGVSPVYMFIVRTYAL